MDETNELYLRNRITTKDIGLILGFKRAQAERIYRTMRIAKERRMNQRDIPRAIKKVFLFAQDVADEFDVPVETIIFRINQADLNKKSPRSA